MGNSIREKAFKHEVPSEPLYIEEWDTTVLVKGMSLNGQAAFLAALPDAESPNRTKKIMATTVIMTTYDPETGKPVFDKADAKHILEGDTVPYRKIIDVANRLLGLSSTEEIEEDLGKDQPDA